MDDLDQELKVTRMCDVFGASWSGYYAWMTRPSNQQGLLEAILEIHAEVNEVYGSPRMHRELQERGYEASENMVAKLMRGSVKTS